MKDYFLGVDIGTGSVKLVATNHVAEVLYSVQHEYSFTASSENYFEQDPQEIWAAVVAVISAATSRFKTAPSGICFSAAMHSIILMDDHNSCLTPMIAWADNRASEIAASLHKSSIAELLYEQTGTPIHSMSPLCKIIWFRENQSAVFEKARKFISIKEYIWFRLFGEFEVDCSIASATGLFDLEKLQWNTNALVLARITADQLSVPRNSDFIRTGPAKNLALDLGVSASTPFVIGSSDGCLANVGSFAVGEGVAALTIGTSGAFRVAGQKPRFNFKAMTFNYLLDHNTFISGGPTNNGGIVLKWYAQQLLGVELNGREDYEELLSAAANVTPGADGLIFLPYLLGERSPIWNSKACGNFFGIELKHSQAHFTRAVLEGICFTLFDISRQLGDTQTLRQINVSGGFIRSRLWLQMIADIFGRTINISNTADASAFGACLLGLKAVGAIRSYDQVSPSKFDTMYPNQDNTLMYQDQYVKFRKLYASLYEIMNNR